MNSELPKPCSLVDMKTNFEAGKVYRVTGECILETLELIDRLRNPQPATGQTAICSVTGRPWSECDCGNCERGPSTATGQTAQPRIWRIWRVDWKDGYGIGQTACRDRKQADSLAMQYIRHEYNYARVQFSDDNGATWVDEQTAQEPKDAA